MGVDPCCEEEERVGEETLRVCGRVLCEQVCFGWRRHGGYCVYVETYVMGCGFGDGDLVGKGSDYVALHYSISRSLVRDMRDPRLWAAGSVKSRWTLFHCTPWIAVDQ